VNSTRYDKLFELENPFEARQDDVTGAFFRTLSPNRPHYPCGPSGTGYSDLIAAHICLTDPVLRGDYLNDGIHNHSAWVDAHMAELYPSPKMHWEGVILDALQHTREDVLRDLANLELEKGEIEETDPAFQDIVMQAAATHLRAQLVAFGIPSYLPAAKMHGFHAFNVAPYFRRLLGLEEFADARHLLHDWLVGAEDQFLEKPLRLDLATERFEILWRANAWTKNGDVVHGSCTTTSKKDRALYTGAGMVPLWRHTYNLVSWLLWDGEDRTRLVHHELCHASFDPETKKAGSRSHAMAENLETIARFGAGSPLQALMLLIGRSHPRTRRVIEAAGWDGDQGILPLFLPPLAEEEGVVDD